MSSEFILGNAEGPVYEIRINRPDKLNALTDKMYGQLIEQLNLAESDDSIKVILLRKQ